MTSAGILDLGDLRLAMRDILLRPLEARDAEGLAVAAGEGTHTYALTPVPRGEDEARGYVERALQQRAAGLRYPFAIERDGVVVGSTSFIHFQPWTWPDNCPLQRQGRPDALEIGHTWLAASAQRTSCNTLAKFLLLRHAFEDLEVIRVSFRTDEHNQRSRRAIERIGARFDGILRADKPGVDCRVRNSACYSILAPEWPAIRVGLLRALSPA